MTSPRRRARWGPSLIIGIGGAALLAALGLVTSRPDIVAMGLPLALWSAAALARRAIDPTATVALSSRPSVDGEVRTAVEVSSAADAVELVIVQARRRTRRLLVPGTGAVILARSRVLHSGPMTAVQATARGVLSEGAILARPTDVVADERDIAPVLMPLETLPVPRSLVGLHGAHEGRRSGNGGDFRDITPFAPGDELRRVDWRATARTARRPGDLLVRRTNTLSDASVVIAVDTSEDLGTVVASWGSGDPTRSGVTSLDRARQAARSIATTAIGSGDRVALHVLVYGGASVRSGSGARHRARLETVIASIGQAVEDSRFRRTPQVPRGSVIYILSTFFGGAAVETAMMWRAGGHRVVAVDTLPDLDRGRLTRAQQLSLRVVLAERENVFADLRGAGVDVLAWSAQASIDLQTASRVRR